MQRPKISLSPEESALVQDPQWLLTKRSIMEKVAALLGQLADEYRGQASSTDRIPAEARSRMPKLSKGENYKGLPYMVLDYPCIWDREHVLAVRTMFWWGNYFSVCLHLKGHFMDQFLSQVLAALSHSKDRDWYLAVGKNEWTHDVQDGGYARLGDLSPTQRTALSTHSFFKAVEVIPLEHWDNAGALLGEGFGEIMRWIS